ncbi:MAG: N-acyl-D-amino-acid deacylase family protein [Alphaproteobacteria bacterium]
MHEFDLLIRGGTIIDGTGMSRFKGDIGIKDGVIAKTGLELTGSAAQVIDAEGKIIAPGVIDLHTHYDAQIHWDPYCTNSGWHGTTSVVVGNCGFGFAPCKPENRDRYMLMMENTEQVPYEVMGRALPWTWETFPQWMDHLRALPKGINISSFLPLNALMIHVMGIDAAKSRPATADERRQMATLLNEAMDAGAIGFAFSYQGMKNGHTDYDGSPMPTDIMDPEEAFLLGEVLRERGQGFIQVLSDLPGCATNRGIIEELAERSRRPILHNILQIMDQAPEYHEGILEWLDDMAAKGHAVYTQAMSMRSWTEFNFVDYNFWDGIDPIFKEFSLAGDAGDKLALAADPDYRARFRATYTPEAMMEAGGPLESFKLVDAHGTAPYADFEGQLLGEIAAARGLGIVDLFFDLFIATDAQAEVRTTLLGTEDPELVAKVLRHPRVLFGASDGGAHVKYWSGGQFSTDVIMWLARESQQMSLEDIHFKLSYLPARFAGFDGRGALLPGYAADVMIYDFDALSCDLSRYRVVNDLPGGDCRRVTYAEGVDAVIVNGQVTFGKGSTCTNAVPGRVLSPTPPVNHASAPSIVVAAE